MDVIANELNNVPPVTKGYLSLCLLLTFFVIWRLITSFCFFGGFDFNFFFNMLFVYRYCRWLEENWYRRKAAEFLLMFLFCGVLTVICALFCDMLFLSQVLTMMLVYVWSRRNPLVLMDIFGFITVRAPYLPWVFFSFSFLLGNSVIVDIVGIAIGHFYYFLEDVFPYQTNGFKVLIVPTGIKRLIDGNPDDAAYEPLPEERPGGYNWVQ